MQRSVDKLNEQTGALFGYIPDALYLIRKYFLNIFLMSYKIEIMKVYEVKSEVANEFCKKDKRVA